MPCVIDGTRWPLLRVVWNGPASNEEFAAYLRAMEQNLARTKAAGTRTAILTDARAAASVNSVQRKMQADWMKAHERDCRHYCIGFAFVVDNAFIRGALTAILWLAPLPAEHIVCSTPDEADTWLCDRLRAAGVSLPAGAGVPAKLRVA